MRKLGLGLVIAAVILGFSGKIDAQVPSTSTTSPQVQPLPSKTPPSVTQPSIAPTATSPDLALLSKAVGKFWQTNRAQTESQIVMKLRDKNVNIQVYATAKTIVETGNKFRTELSFAQPGERASATYTIVSNGEKVWIYRPDQRKYSQTTFAKFQSESYSFLIGASSIFFLSISEADRQEMTTAFARDRNFLALLPKEQIQDLQGTKRQINGRDTYVYSYEDKKENWTFNGFIQPETGVLDQIELAGKTDGMNFTLTEKLLDRNTQAKIDAQTFRFSPPKGAKKVKSLPIDLLGG